MRTVTAAKVSAIGYTFDTDFPSNHLTPSISQHDQTGETATVFLRNYLFPLPPLAEQHRIVAKIDELMALCDQLKAVLRTAQATQLNLAYSLTHQAI